MKTKKKMRTFSAREERRGEERSGQRRGEPRERESNAPWPASERAPSGERPTSSERYQRASRTSAPPLPRHGMDGYVGRTWASCNGRLQFTPRFLEGKILSFICLLFSRVRFLSVGLSSDRKSTQTIIKGCVSRRDNVSSFVVKAHELEE